MRRVIVTSAGRCRIASICSLTCASVSGPSAIVSTAGAALELVDVALERLQVPAVVQAVGGDEQDPLAARVARHERQEVERRRVGPVDVLDDQHHRRLVGQPREQLEQVLVLAALRAA